MNNTLFGFVASLIATLALFLGSTQAQAQVASDRLTVVEFKIDQIGGADGTGCGGPTIAKNHYTMIDDVKVIDPVLWAQLPQSLRDQIPTGREIELLDAGIAGPWYRTGNNFEAWKLGTPGTVAMHRIQAVQFCSHLWITEVDLLYGENAIAWLVRQRDGAGNQIYKDNGASFGVKIPVNGYPLTGTRMAYRAYNGAAFKRGQLTVPVAYLENDPNWRFIFNWVRWEETQLLPGWELARIDADASTDPNAGKFLIPADAKSVWVANQTPDGVVNDPVYGLTGNYLSVFNMDTQNWAASARVDVSVSGKSRSVDFDNSRDVAYMPRGSFRTFQAKSTGPTVTHVAMVPDTRLAALVYERTGEVFHLAGSDYGNRVFVWNPKTDTIWDFIPATGVVPNLDTTVDGHIQGAIFGNTFFRVIGINNYTQTKVEVYDIPDRAQRATYIINKQLANGGGVFGARPQMSFDPNTNSLWFATIYDGSLGELDLDTGVFADFPIPQEAGVAVGATDVKVDSLRNKLYVSIAKFRPVWQGASTPFVDGSLYEIDLATKQIARQVTLQVYPWSVAILPTSTGTYVAVTNNATVSGNNVSVPSTISVVNVSNFAEVARLQTQKQPTAMAVEFKD